MRAGGDGVFVPVNDQPGADFFTEPVPEFDHLFELVSGIDVEERKRQRSGIEGLAGQVYEYARVLSDGIEQNRVPELSDSLPQNINGFAFKLAKVRPVLVHAITALC